MKLLVFLAFSEQSERKGDREKLENFVVDVNYFVVSSKKSRSWSGAPLYRSSLCR